MMTLRSGLYKLSIIHCLTYSHLFQKTHTTVPWLLRVEQFQSFLRYSSWVTILKSDSKFSISFLGQLINCCLQNWLPEQNRKIKWDPQNSVTFFVCEKILLQYIGEIVFINHHFCLVNRISICFNQNTHTQKHQPYIKENWINWTLIKTEPLLKDTREWKSK